MPDLQSAQQFEVDMLRIRLLLVFATLAWIGLGRWFSRRGSNKARAAGPWVLLVLALTSYASYYDFFRAQHGTGFKSTDVYHYYMGSKYFAEVGYFDLYPCTVAVLVDSGVESQFDMPRIRDQRTLRFAAAEDALAMGRACQQRFTAPRWRAFEADVGWFGGRMQRSDWHAIFRDHGYNPTPVWGAIGALASDRVALGSGAFDVLLRLDRVLMLASFGFMFWAFGAEVAALAVIVWGTGHHWSYVWIGDSFLRNLWLAALLIGISLLRKKRYAAAGAGLALSSLLRIFPGAFVATLFAKAARSYFKAGRVPDGLLRLFAGAGIFALVAVLGTLLVSGQGLTGFIDFAEKIAAFRDRPGLNKIGLSSLSWRAVMTAAGSLVTDDAGKLILSPVSGWWVTAWIRGLQLVVLVPAVFLFWRAIPRARNWEAACMGFALIPLVSSPANYYYSFVICGVLLGAERPRVSTYTLLAAAMWILNALYFYRRPDEYLVAGLIAVVYAIAVLYEIAFAEAVPELEAA